MTVLPPELTRLLHQLDAVEADARDLTRGLSAQDGAWRPSASSWSIAECLDHLAIANRVYLDAMRLAAARARERGRLRRGPAVPGLLGGLFVRSLEPPARLKSRTPEAIRPRQAPPLPDAREGFLASHEDVRAFLRGNADLDLAHTRFRNPFIKGVRFSLATGLHVIAAHERRHLWQARRIRSAQQIVPA